jgi:hypothetical protein
VQKGSALALACRPLVFSGVWRSRPPGGGSLWGPGLGPLYALDKLVRACASSPKISWGGHQILPTATAAASTGAETRPNINKAHRQTPRRQRKREV